MLDSHFIPEWRRWCLYLTRQGTPQHPRIQDLTVEGPPSPDMGSLWPLTMIIEFISASCRWSLYCLKVKFKCEVLAFGISNISWLLPFPVKNGLKCKMNNFNSFFQFFPSNKMFRFSSIGYFWHSFCVCVCVGEGGGQTFHYTDILQYHVKYHAASRYSQL